MSIQKPKIERCGGNTRLTLESVDKVIISVSNTNIKDIEEEKDKSRRYYYVKMKNRSVAIFIHSDGHLHIIV